MYKTLKTILRIGFPQNFLFKHELFLRSFYALLFFGNKYKCNVCNKHLRSFKTVGNDKMCPACGSLSRNRRLWEILKTSYLNDGISILDFSPSRNLYRELKKRKLSYTASDLSGDFISDVQFDITNIAAKNNSYDLIICYHILEHVIDDTQAMKELFRVLKDTGTCIIQTPFKDGEIYEDYTITEETQRRIHFGQEDHVRIYSIDGLKERLTNTSFQVEILNYFEEKNQINGYSEKDTILICNKPSNS